MRYTVQYEFIVKMGEINCSVFTSNDIGKQLRVDMSELNRHDLVERLSVGNNHLTNTCLCFRDVQAVSPVR